MKIKDIIKQTYIEHPNPRLHEHFDLALKYKKYAQKSNISFLQTFSTSFFPKLITSYKGSEQCIVWDNHFWDLFERYLLAIVKIEKNEISSSVAYDLFMSIYMIFLSTKFYKNPALSLVFAKRYAATGFFVPPYYIKSDVTVDLELYGSAEHLRYCKDFVYFHEMHHAQYNRDQNLKYSDFKLIRETCHKLDTSSLSQETKEIIKKMLSLSDTSILEELCCDVNSICCIVYIYSGGNHYSKAIAQDVIKSIRFISLFISNLKKIELVYQKRCITNNNKEIQDYIMGENYIEVEARNYIVYFVSLYLMGFSKMNIQSDFFMKDEFFFKYFRPYYDILRFDFISNIFLESELYRREFSKDDCKVARDIIIGWHNN